MPTTQTFHLSDHLLKHGWNFAGGGGHSLLWLGHKIPELHKHLSY